MQMNLNLNFKSYEDYVNSDYFSNEENVLRDAAKYIEHKKSRDGVYKYNGYPGVTSVEDMMRPEQKVFIEKWRRKLLSQGKDPDYVTKQYADTGTAVHYAVEMRISPVFIDPPKWELDQYPDNCEEFVGNGLYMWSLLTGGENPTLKIEKPMCEVFCKNEKYRYSGFYDLYAVINGKRTICDFKTSPTCKDNYLLQLGAYSLNFDKMPEQAMIINLCPDDRNPQLRPLVTTLNQEQLTQAKDGWVAMVRAFHDIFDEFLPITDSHHDAQLRNATQMK